MFGEFIQKSLLKMAQDYKAQSPGKFIMTTRQMQLFNFKSRENRYHDKKRNR